MKSYIGTIGRPRRIHSDDLGTVRYANSDLTISGIKALRAGDIVKFKLDTRGDAFDLVLLARNSLTVRQEAKRPRSARLMESVR